MNTANVLCCEHIIPVSKSGETSLDNLALSCGGCNGYKYTKQEAINPISSESVPLYPPRQEVWTEHFVWSKDGLEIVGITPTGRATIDAINLNRSGVKNIRRLLAMANLHPPVCVATCNSNHSGLQSSRF